MKENIFFHLYWTDLKLRVKNRAVLYKQDATSTGGGPAQVTSLSRLGKLLFLGMQNIKSLSLVTK
ncbi:unnamed protein product [Acanthoscelides obtectus]|uniref:Uncharacterized protein n=1 Tax=Acanthoscelides obtectus TaxID=200917 RepID=A0A9P0KGR3_ACAOB|nr:unnamed protein product [Acanthoscelides obtectus]CAK1639606.1 hypothetical protein AOBTE_LOCUS11271 [Acanthoscelides obtectus]